MQLFWLKKFNVKVGLLLSSFLCSQAYAIDLGVKAKIFDIIEEDIRVTIMREMAAKLDPEQHKKELEQKAENFYKKLPIVPLPHSRKFERKYVDPTKIYEDDFWSLTKDADGRMRWVKSVEAGQGVNWLEHNPSPMQMFFIFDYGSSTQRELARRVVALGDTQVKVVFTGGDLTKAIEDMEYPLTYLNQPVIDEYDVEYTPTVVKRGSGEHRNFYQVTRFNVDEVTAEEVIAEIKGREK